MDTGTPPPGGSDTPQGHSSLSPSDLSGLAGLTSLSEPRAGPQGLGASIRRVSVAPELLPRSSRPAGPTAADRLEEALSRALPADAPDHNDDGGTLQRRVQSLIEGKTAAESAAETALRRAIDAEAATLTAEHERDAAVSDARVSAARAAAAASDAAQLRAKATTAAAQARSSELIASDARAAANATIADVAVLRRERDDAATAAAHAQARLRAGEAETAAAAARLAEMRQERDLFRCEAGELRAAAERSSVDQRAADVAATALRDDVASLTRQLEEAQQRVAELSEASLRGTQKVPTTPSLELAPRRDDARVALLERSLNAAETKVAAAVAQQHSAERDCLAAEHSRDLLRRQLALAFGSSDAADAAHVPTSVTARADALAVLWVEAEFRSVLTEFTAALELEAARTATASEACLRARCAEAEALAHAHHTAREEAEERCAVAEQSAAESDTKARISHETAEAALEASRQAELRADAVEGSATALLHLGGAVLKVPDDAPGLVLTPPSDDAPTDAGPGLSGPLLAVCALRENCERCAIMAEAASGLANLLQRRVAVSELQWASSTVGFAEEMHRLHSAAVASESASTAAVRTADLMFAPLEVEAAHAKADAFIAELSAAHTAEVELCSAAAKAARDRADAAVESADCRCRFAERRFSVEAEECAARSSLLVDAVGGLAFMLDLEHGARTTLLERKLATETVSGHTTQIALAEADAQIAALTSDLAALRRVGSAAPRRVSVAGDGDAAPADAPRQDSGALLSHSFGNVSQATSVGQIAGASQPQHTTTDASSSRGRSPTVSRRGAEPVSQQSSPGLSPASAYSPHAIPMQLPATADPGPRNLSLCSQGDGSFAAPPAVAATFAGPATAGPGTALHPAPAAPPDQRALVEELRAKASADRVALAVLMEAAQSAMAAHVDAAADWAAGSVEEVHAALQPAIDAAEAAVARAHSAALRSESDACDATTAARDALHRAVKAEARAATVDKHEREADEYRAEATESAASLAAARHRIQTLEQTVAQTRLQLAKAPLAAPPGEDQGKTGSTAWVRFSEAQRALARKAADAEAAAIAAELRASTAETKAQQALTESVQGIAAAAEAARREGDYRAAVAVAESEREAAERTAKEQQGARLKLEARLEELTQELSDVRSGAEQTAAKLRLAEAKVEARAALEARRAESEPRSPILPSGGVALSATLSVTSTDTDDVRQRCSQLGAVATAAAAAAEARRQTRLQAVAAENAAVAAEGVTNLAQLRDVLTDRAAELDEREAMMADRAAVLGGERTAAEDRLCATARDAREARLIARRAVEQCDDLKRGASLLLVQRRRLMRCMRAMEAAAMHRHDGSVARGVSAGCQTEGLVSLVDRVTHSLQRMGVLQGTVPVTPHKRPASAFPAAAPRTEEGTNLSSLHAAAGSLVLVVMWQVWQLLMTD